MAPESLLSSCAVTCQRLCSHSGALCSFPERYTAITSAISSVYNKLQHGAERAKFFFLFFFFFCTLYVRAVRSVCCANRQVPTARVHTSGALRLQGQTERKCYCSPSGKMCFAASSVRHNHRCSSKLMDWRYVGSEASAYCNRQPGVPW